MIFSKLYGSLYFFYDGFLKFRIMVNMDINCQDNFKIVNIQNELQTLVLKLQSMQSMQFWNCKNKPILNVCSRNRSIFANFQAQFECLQQK